MLMCRTPWRELCVNFSLGEKFVGLVGMIGIRVL